MIPIYRAKKIDSNEYVIGFYSSAYDINHYVITHLGVDTKTSTVYQMSTDIHKIDVSTLSIHFPNMLDCQGNKIFASLSKDGKGGDMTNKGICLYEPKYNQFRIIVNLETRTWLEITREDLESYPIKVIGIQQ